MLAKLARLLVGVVSALVYLFFSGNVAAAEFPYFQFVPMKRVLSPTGEVTLKMYYDLGKVPEDRFRVRPVVSHGAVQVWDEDIKIWVPGTAKWLELPELSDQLKLKFPTAGFVNSNIRLQIQDVETADIYYSNDQKVWSRLWLVDYLAKLNENISAMVKYPSENP